MIHEAYMPVYMGSRFLARDGRTEVVQEALADLKSCTSYPNSSLSLLESISRAMLSFTLSRTT